MFSGCFDEIKAFFCEGRCQTMGHSAVIETVFEAVAFAGAMGIKVAFAAEDEALAVFFFKVEYAVVCENFQVDDADLIHGFAPPVVRRYRGCGERAVHCARGRCARP